MAHTALLGPVAATCVAPTATTIASSNTASTTGTTTSRCAQRPHICDQIRVVFACTFRSRGPAYIGARRRSSVLSVFKAWRFVTERTA